ncbi:MAG: hypothetical protein HQ579_08260 [Candidatus Omnitrophica bacterium]|nr:hypothetical protein [Candidatus Omnitrophota bacterium]
MRWITQIFILLGVLVIAGIGGYFGYNAAYAKGETAGYENGYSSGNQEGYVAGEADGYTKGRTDGYEVGEAEGFISGQQEGYTEGKADGYQDGYSKGEPAGYDRGYSTGLDEGFGHGYTIKDPTYAEAIAFMRGDKTDQNEYIDDSFVCSHFVREVCNNAEAEGIRCALVLLRLAEPSGSDHVIIAFNTIDQGIVYFETITDDRANPVIGKRYYQCIVPEPDHYYEQPSYDDTIKEILIIW